MPRGALARIALLALIWGSSFLWIKLADHGFSAVEVTVGRLATGAAVLFLASDESSFITANTFLVDGGISGAYVTPL